MTVVLPNGKNPPHVQRQRDEFSAELVPVMEQLRELSCAAYNRGDTVKLNTMDFHRASEHIDAAWRAMGHALSVVRGG